MTFPAAALLLLAAASAADAHLAAWSKGMFCKNDLSTTDQPNAALAIQPLYNQTFANWWFHGPCINYPPPSGEFLNIPANGNFTVEIAANRAFTTLSYNGAKSSAWPDGKAHPDNYNTNNVDPMFPLTSTGCLSSPNLHAHNVSDAAGTAFAISYNNDITKAQVSDFTVFSVLQNTPWKRIATYQVPNLPACPTGGCLCAWAWIPNHCGQDNMYFNGYRCQVTGALASAKAVASPSPPVWCESDQGSCLVGAKQFTIQYQQEGNNVKLPGGFQKDGSWPSPGYNSKMGFTAGAQTDIFSNAVAAATPNTCPNPSTTVTVQFVKTSTVTSTSTVVVTATASAAKVTSSAAAVTTSTSAKATSSAAARRSFFARREFYHPIME